MQHSRNIETNKKSDFNLNSRKSAFTLAEVFLPHSVGCRKSAFTLAEVFSPHSASSRKVAFTLAEVLITLGIIGVVAAMTLPTLIADHQKKVTVNKVKKVYSIFSQVGERSFGENYWDGLTLPDSNEEKEEILKNYVLKYLKILKYCGNTFPNDCVATEPKTLKDDKLTDLVRNNDKTFYFTLIDGTSVTSWEGNSGDHIMIYFDINGIKKPNKLGKDIFSLVMASNNFITKQGVVMTGLYDSATNTVPTDRNYIKDNFKYSCNKNAGGQFCGALIQYDGWKISDDYPW